MRLHLVESVNKFGIFLLLCGLSLPFSAEAQLLTQDELLERRLSSKLLASTELEGSRLRVEVEGRRVILGGEIPTEGELNQAVEEIREECPECRVEVVARVVPGESYNL